MIDKRMGDKPMFFELSIGNAGNTLDGHNETTHEHSDSDSDDNLGKCYCTCSLLCQNCIVEKGPDCSNWTICEFPKEKLDTSVDHHGEINQETKHLNFIYRFIRDLVLKNVDRFSANLSLK